MMATALADGRVRWSLSTVEAWADARDADRQAQPE